MKDPKRLLDGDGTVTSRYGARALPSTYLVDRDGRVVAQAIGARDWAGPPAQALVRALLAPTTARP